MTVVMQADGPPLRLVFPDLATIQFDKPFHGWITINDDGKLTWLNGAYVMSIGQDATND